MFPFLPAACWSLSGVHKLAKMKKLFWKDQSNKDPTHGSFLGKVFVVGRHTVTVEEVIAEGKYLSLLKVLLGVYT